ncbi:MAG: sensor histidine kinase [Cyclobacteriaceae bacterium]
MNWLLKKHIYYSAFGAIFFAFWFLFKVGGFVDIPISLLSTLFDVAATMTALIVTVELLLPRLVYKKKYAQFFISYLVIVFLGGATIILTQLELLGQSLFTYQKHSEQEHYFYWFWADLIFGSFTLVFFITSVGVAIRLAFDRLKESNKAEQLTKEKALTELELLKEQINPHFLFNALNTIYYKIDRNNTEGRETLQRFSNMLRYQLYECNKLLVEIENELSFIKSYIELQKERLNKNYTVNYTGFEEIKGVLVSPFLLLPLVENCFKHVSDYPEKENNITINCKLEKDIFWFTTLNTKASDQVSKESGIGLANIKKRLQLIYPNKYELEIKNTVELFSVKLKLVCS